MPVCTAWLSEGASHKSCDRLPGVRWVCDLVFASSAHPLSALVPVLRHYPILLFRPSPQSHHLLLSGLIIFSYVSSNLRWTWNTRLCPLTPDTKYLIPQFAFLQNVLLHPPVKDAQLISTLIPCDPSAPSAPLLQTCLRHLVGRCPLSSIRSPFARGPPPPHFASRMRSTVPGSAQHEGFHSRVH